MSVLGFFFSPHGLSENQLDLGIFFFPIADLGRTHLIGLSRAQYVQAKKHTTGTLDLTGLIILRVENHQSDSK